MPFSTPSKQPANTGVSITIEHGNLTLVATLPEIFAALAPVLPIANKLFGGKKARVVSSRDLHSALEIVRDHSTWVAGLIKQYDLVENVDMIIERLDKGDPDNWEAIKANGGKVPTVYLFPPKLAAQIATMTRSNMGKKIWDYMYAVTDAAHDTVEAYYVKQLAESKVGEARAWGECRKLEDTTKQLALSKGYKGLQDSINHLEQSFKDAESGVKREKNTRAGQFVDRLSDIVKQSAESLRKVKANPAKVLQVASELENSVDEIFGGNPYYVPDFPA